MDFNRASFYHDHALSEDFLRLVLRFFRPVYALRAVFLLPPLRVERFLVFDFFLVLVPLSLRIFAPQALAAFEPFFK